jgi:hypothetical protein
MPVLLLDRLPIQKEKEKKRKKRKKERSSNVRKCKSEEGQY